MMCFRDRTFCGFYADCKHGGTCRASLTEEVRRRAAEIRLPICEFLEKPECFEGVA